MFTKEGSFEAVEKRLLELWARESEERLDGGWHTTISLGALNWTECSPQHVHDDYMLLLYVYTSLLCSF